MFIVKKIFRYFQFAIRIQIMLGRFNAYRYIYSAAVLEKNKLKDAFPYQLINLAQFVVGGVFFLY